MSAVEKLVGDFAGLWRICGPSVALRWSMAVGRSVPSILRRRSLLAADARLGAGPFEIAMGGAYRPFRISGSHAISGIREMYVRNVYLKDGWLRVADGDVVLDLGANIGNFTNLALAAGPNVRVVAVEPNARLNAAMLDSLALNRGFGERVQLVRAFVGEAAPKHATMSVESGYEGAPWITEEQLIRQTGLARVDLIKCDIEGGEFALFSPSSALLRMTRALAIEIHAFAGSVADFVERLRSAGFEIGPVQKDPDGTVTLLARRAAS